jgi:hypothetical protein
MTAQIKQFIFISKLMYAYLWRFCFMCTPKGLMTDFFTMYDEKTNMPMMLLSVKRRDKHNTNKVHVDIVRIFWMRGPVSRTDSCPVKDSKTTIQL